MSNFDIIRAWKDEEYRESLSEEQRSQLPENPAGIIEMSDEEMESLGGASHGCGGSYGCDSIACSAGYCVSAGGTCISSGKCKFK